MLRIVPKDININFVGAMKPAYVVSGLVVVLSLVLLLFGSSFGFGPTWGIDFAGGTEIQIKVDPSISIEEIRQGMESLDLSGDSVQRFGAEEDHSYLVRVQNVNFGAEESADAIWESLRRAHGEDVWDGKDYDPEQGMFLQVHATKHFDALEVQKTLARDPALADILGDRALEPLPNIEGDEEDGGADEASIEDDVAESTDAQDEALVDTESEDELDDDDEAVKEVATWVTESLSKENSYTIQIPGFLEKVKRNLQGAFGAENFEVERVESVGPKVGAELRAKGVQALLISLAMILVYIAFRFDLAFAPGAVAALLHDVLVTIMVFIVLGIEFNITIIAALLTIVGYSLNDTIVVYDRIRENLRRYKRKNLVDVVNISVNETLSRTIMTSITTLIVVVCLTVLGGPIIRPFSIALTTGVLVGTYSSVFIASPLILWLQRWMPIDPGES